MQNQGKSFSSSSASPPARRIPLGLVPLLVYLGVTLVAPGLNGASRRDGFWEHAVITLGLSGLLGWPWAVACSRSSPPARNGRAAAHVRMAGLPPRAVTDATAVTKERA